MVVFVNLAVLFFEFNIVAICCADDGGRSASPDSPSVSDWLAGISRYQGQLPGAIEKNCRKIDRTYV